MKILNFSPLSVKMKVSFKNNCGTKCYLYKYCVTVLKQDRHNFINPKSFCVHTPNTGKYYEGTWIIGGGYFGNY